MINEQTTDIIILPMILYIAIKRPVFNSSKIIDRFAENGGSMNCENNSSARNRIHSNLI